jgi:hypothetical protein
MPDPGMMNSWTRTSGATHHETRISLIWWILHSLNHHSHSSGQAYMSAEIPRIAHWCNNTELDTPGHEVSHVSPSLYNPANLFPDPPAPNDPSPDRDLRFSICPHKRSPATAAFLSVLLEAVAVVFKECVMSTAGALQAKQ